MAILRLDGYRGVFDSIRHIGVMEIRGLSDIECYSKYWRDNKVEIELEMEDGKKIVEYKMVSRDKMYVTYSLKILKVCKVSVIGLPEDIARQLEDKKRVVLGIEVKDVFRAVNIIRQLASLEEIDELDDLLNVIVVYKPNIFAPFVVRVEGIHSYFAFISPRIW